MSSNEVGIPMPSDLQNYVAARHELRCCANRHRHKRSRSTKSRKIMIVAGSTGPSCIRNTSVWLTVIVHALPNVRTHIIQRTDAHALRRREGNCERRRFPPAPTYWQWWTVRQRSGSEDCCITAAVQQYPVALLVARPTAHSQESGRNAGFARCGIGQLEAGGM